MKNPIAHGKRLWVSHKIQPARRAYRSNKNKFFTVGEFYHEICFVLDLMTIFESDIINTYNALIPSFSLKKPQKRYSVLTYYGITPFENTKQVTLNIAISGKYHIPQKQAKIDMQLPGI